MRKFILIASMMLLSASAQAGASRGLTLASSNEPVVAEQPKTVDTPKAIEGSSGGAPKLAERTAAVDTAVDQTRVNPAPGKKAEKPRHKPESTEARVIYELHRHGIYW